jgi:hypothetical protein
MVPVGENNNGTTETYVALTWSRGMISLRTIVFEPVWTQRHASSGLIPPSPYPHYANQITYAI